MHELIPLNLLNAGQIAEIGQIMGGPDFVHRLHELGLKTGAVVEMVRPGSPCILQLAGNRLCFRADELVSVLVRTGVCV